MERESCCLFLGDNFIVPPCTHMEWSQMNLFFKDFFSLLSTHFFHQCCSTWMTLLKEFNNIRYYTNQWYFQSLYFSIDFQKQNHLVKWYFSNETIFVAFVDDTKLNCWTLNISVKMKLFFFWLNSNTVFCKPSLKPIRKKSRNAHLLYWQKNTKTEIKIANMGKYPRLHLDWQPCALHPIKLANKNHPFQIKSWRDKV